MSKANADNTILHPNLETAISRLVRLDATLQSLMQASGDGRRSVAEKLVEELIGFLDASDGDPDREDDTIDSDADADAEEDDPAEDDGDKEPSLGSLKCEPRGGYVGDEIEHRASCQRYEADWGEPYSGHDEPYAVPGDGDQSAWAASDRSDGEQAIDDERQEDPAEMGIADPDALHELYNELHSTGQFDGSGMKIAYGLLSGRRRSRSNAKRR